MDIEQLRDRWTDVLDLLEREDRIAWIAFFDARLAGLEGSTLLLDFSDSRKFATGHDYGETRKHHRFALQEAIHTVFGVDLEVIEKL
ncbi:MAG: hypothetical protein AABY37_03075 [Actinomycetota bacterium]